IDFVLNAENEYDIKALLILSCFGYDASLELIWKNHTLYMTVLGQTIQLTKDDLMDLISKQNVSSANEKILDLALMNFVLSSNQIDLNLEQMLDFVLAIIIHFEKIEDSLNVDLDVNYEDLNINASMSLSKSNLTEVLVPTENMMDYSDINEWLEQIDYLVKLIQNEAIHIDLEPTSIKLDLDQEVTVQGSFDVLLQNDSYALAGWIDLDGFGMTLRVDITLMDDTIYVSMLGQTIVLEISKIDSFIQDIMSILAPLMNSTMSLTRKINFNLDDLSLKMDANQLEVTLDSLIGDLCRVALVIDVLMQEEEQWLDLILDIDYSSLSISNIHLKISPSMISSIVAPNETITKEDILKICEYVVLAYQMKEQTEFGFVINTNIIKNGVVVAHIEGEISLRLLLETNEFDAKIDLFVDEFNANGDATAWHQVHLNVISATTMQEISSTISEAMLIGTYGNYAADQEQVIKIKSTYQGIKHLIQSIMSLLNLDVNSIEIAPSNMNLNHLLASLMVDSQALNIGIYANSLFNGIDLSEVIDLNISKDENRITSLNINNLYVSYTNEFNFMKLDHLSVDLMNPADLELAFALPTDLDSYYDISNTAYLFEALYHNALERDFEITGTVELQALSVIKKDVEVLIQVHVEENGEPTIYARLDIPSVWPLLSQKKLHIYYADQYVYIYREDSTAKDSKKIKIHYETFISNIVYYLLDFGMGMPDLVLNEINDSNAKKKGYVNAADCVNQVAFSENRFQIGLNLGEITDNSNLGNLNFTIESALVSQDNELVPMITKITEFSFNMVSVIKLTLKKNTELILSNIVEEDGMLVVSEMDFSSIYQYISDYGYDEDIEYSYNGKDWVAGNMVSHSAIFINEYANEQITKEYYKNDLVVFPIYDVINANEEYYRFEGWYYDAAFQNNVDGPYYMNNRNATFYAKFVLVTSEYIVNSPYGTAEYQLHTYEDQSLEPLFKEYQDKVVTVGDQTWRFIRFELLKDDEWFLFDEQTAMIGTYILRACWEEVYYTAYIVESNETIKLSSLSEEIVSSNAFIKSNEFYYGYLNNTLTQSILLNEYISMFDEDNQINIYSLDDVSLLRMIEFDFTKVDSIYQNKSYNAIASFPGDDISTYLPNGSTEQFEINAWISLENYYSADAVSNILENVTIEPYITSKKEFFSFDGSVMTSYQSDSSRTNLITPMYVNNILITKIGTEVFKDEQYVSTVVLSEGIAEIEEYAFQNALALKDVYLPTTLTAIGSNVFLFDFSSDFAKCRDTHASLLRLYYVDEKQNNTFGDLNACYPASAKKQIFHYGKKETHVFWSADLRDTFQKATNGNNLIEISYAIINH
ncbi:MAG: leucine-rich repeat protein, partial [Anaeroplasmataceae bacterium]|nr:leucine-rich repeat protein [Anaeroplasmataceae bacterium]